MADESAYHLKLGQLVSNFHTLEFMLRTVLVTTKGALPIGFPSGKDVYSYPVGSELPVSDLTSYDTLGDLIEKFNERTTKTHEDLIDITLIDLRNALVHGRVSSRSLDGHQRLLKFSKPVKNSGVVTVTFNKEMTLEWLSEQCRRVYMAIEIAMAELPPQDVAISQVTCCPKT